MGEASALVPVLQCRASGACISPLRVLRRSSLRDLHVRQTRPSDFPEICSWVRSGRALRIVSSDDGNRLTPDILGRWIAAAEQDFVVALTPSDRAVGFCVLSREEAPLGEGMIEFCHQVLNPWRISLQLSFCLCEAAKAFAHSRGFKFIVTRCLPSNRYALSLALLEGMTEITGKEPWASSPFRWFDFDMAGYLVSREFASGLKGEIGHERPTQNLVCK